MRRRSWSRPCIYFAYRDEPGTGVVIGSFASCVADVHRDTERLYGPGTKWVSKSRATAETKRLARRADDAGLPVARPIGHKP